MVRFSLDEHVPPLADRAVFWAELGVVAAPSLLSRLGHAVQNAAEGDPEMREALRLAAEHVESKCLVWRADIRDGSVAGDSSHADGDTLSDGQRIRGDSAAGNFVCGVSSENDDFSDDDPETSRRFKGISEILPGSPFVGLLPGLGGFFGKLFWTGCLVVVALRYAYKASQPKDSSGGLSSKISRLIMGIIATKLLSWVPLVLSIANLVESNTFEDILRAELSSVSGERLRSFMRASSIVVGLVLPLLLFVQQWLLRFELGHSIFRYDYLLLWFPVAFVSVIVFLLVWRLSVSKIDHLRDRISLKPEDFPGGWLGAAREYRAIAQDVDDMWRGTGLSSAYAVIFAQDIIYIALNLAFTQAGRNVWTSWHWVVRNSVALSVGTYLWAHIHSRCASTARAKNSLLYVARRHLGKVRRHDILDHLCFLHCVEGLPCGVEIPSIGLISMKYVGPVLRVVSIAMPIIIGVGLRFVVTKV